ncbi:MAG TPA: serine/threonine-protein kinase [Kofleriaceae bacterium]|nr:serine/threonine-protein kinase [Kofleriaceae bacterium]
MAGDDPRTNKSGARSHDTDPLADTQAPGDTQAEEAASSSSTSKRRSVQAGDVLEDRYELIEDIGEGGMASVYRAKDRQLRREVAIKVLFPHLARREEVVRRFHREARAAAGLEHANILRVYDVGGSDGNEGNDPPYIVMELIRGRSLLGELEQRGPILAEVVACIGALLADALAVAHKAGIIHRDVKPANVMIAPGGRVLLTDFGVARLETEDSLVTKTGALLGTPAYMSPEQAGGDTATAKSDVYSLGATLYQLATGSLPYSGSPAKVMAQIAQGTLVSAVRRRAAVGPDLSRVIDRMMASDPANRPASAADVADELRKIAASGGFGDPKDELAAYFAEPETFVKERLPKVVASLVTTAERAIADDKLPRAMALADRASALAPDDPAVTQLVHKVTEGSSSMRRRKLLAIIAGGAVLAGGATVGAIQLFGGTHATAPDAALDSRPLDADTSVADAPTDAVTDALIDSHVIANAPDDAGKPDARPARVKTDAGVVAMAKIDAAVAPPDAAIAVDAAVVEPQFGSILVKNDTFCEVKIDGTSYGRQFPKTAKPIRAAVGRHSVTCENSGLSSWTKDADVATGKVTTVEGFMLLTVKVTLEVDATIDNTPYTKGSVAVVKPGSHIIVAGGSKAWVTIKEACRLRSTPDLGCF